MTTLASARREDPRRRLGRLGEELAAAHFRRLGFVLLERNVRTRHGEIDLIALASGVLVFAEVKTARAGAGGSCAARAHPLQWLGARQRARLRRLAAAWLSEHSATRSGVRTIRFDAVGVTVDSCGRLLALEHLEGAW
jgi:putative endonuclease